MKRYAKARMLQMTT